MEEKRSLEVSGRSKFVVVPLVLRSVTTAALYKVDTLWGLDHMSKAVLETEA